MSSEVTRTWAGSPSRIAVSEGPWDSPAVSQRSMGQVFHVRSDAPDGPRAVGPGMGSVAQRLHQGLADEHGEQRADEHVGAVGDPLPQGAADQRAADRA